MKKNAKDKSEPNVVPMIVPPETPAAAQYPEITETRPLKTFINDKERNQAAMENARLVQEIAGLEEDKKASASGYKARIEQRQARQGHLSRLVIDGWEERPQKCAWLFECSGIDTEAKRIYHPDMKCLVRLDTNEVLETLSMTEEDFARKELPLGDGPAGDAADEHDEV